MGAVFGQINQGAGVTAGLRKVTADMKAKNRAPSDRSGKVAAKTAPSARTPAKAKGPAKLELQGNKWVVENQVRSLTPAPRVVRLPAGWLILVLVGSPAPLACFPTGLVGTQRRGAQRVAPSTWWTAFVAGGLSRRRRRPANHHHLGQR